ncbi:M42 family metallopeptidase [soil metagenome]
MATHERLQALVEAYGPSGQEDEIRETFQSMLGDLPSVMDAKGNLLIGEIERPRIVVTAHLDEIAMMVKAIEPSGRLRVAPLGGLHPWKLGEGPVEILASEERMPGALSFGGIHTEDPRSPSVQAKRSGLEWPHAMVVTGRAPYDLMEAGVRPGSRVVVAKPRRQLWNVGSLVCGHFLDDRADLLSMLLTIEKIGLPEGVLFAATASEEVGGEGGLWILNRTMPEVCIALELGPNVPDAPVALTDSPTVWVNDSYAAMAARDIDLMASLLPDAQWQHLSRGGSDASCAASRGVVARPFTLGLPMESSHGFEIMHENAPERLAQATADLLAALS